MKFDRWTIPSHRDSKVGRPIYCREMEIRNCGCLDCHAKLTAVQCGGDDGGMLVIEIVDSEDIVGDAANP